MWLWGGFEPNVIDGEHIASNIEKAGIPGKIPCPRGRIPAETGFSIPHPTFAVLVGCGVAAACRCRVAKTFPQSRAGVPPALGRWTLLSRHPRGLPDGSRKSPGGSLGAATFSKLQGQAGRPPYFFKPEGVRAGTASDNDGERMASSRRPALWRTGIGVIAFG
jgi:hypothetical protein